MDKLMRAIAGTATLALLMAAALSGCGQRGKVYAIPPASARDTLVGTRIPDIAFGVAAHAEPAVATDTGVEWRIDEGPGDANAPGATSNREIMVLTATLVGADDGTLVTVDPKPAPGADRAAFEKKMSDHPAVADMFRNIASEAVDAGLSHRAFEFSHISGQMAIAMVSMLPEIRQQMDDDAKAFERRDRESIDNAYGNAERGR